MTAITPTKSASTQSLPAEEESHFVQASPLDSDLLMTHMYHTQCGHYPEVLKDQTISKKVEQLKKDYDSLAAEKASTPDEITQQLQNARVLCEVAKKLLSQIENASPQNMSVSSDGKSEEGKTQNMSLSSK